MITLTIPGLPPTANTRIGAHVINGKAKLHRSKGATSWQATVGAYGRIAMGRRAVITDKVDVRLVFRCGPRRRRDVDGGVKDTLDGLSGRAKRGDRAAVPGAVIADDRQVRRLVVELEDVADEEDEATVIEVTRSGGTP